MILRSAMGNNKWKIGVYGSGFLTDENKQTPIFIATQTVGKELANHGAIVVTGACSGLPYVAARAARESSGEVWGFAPAKDYASYVILEPRGKHTDKSLYTKMFFVPKDFEFINWHEACCKYRNVTSTASSDAGIIISGKWGTLNEFTNLVDFQKVIGVLVGTGGTADEIPNLWKKIKKAGNKSKVIFDSDPIELVKKVIGELEKNS